MIRPGLSLYSNKKWIHLYLNRKRDFVFRILKKLNNGEVPAVDSIELFHLDNLIHTVKNYLLSFKTKDILNVIFSHFDIINKYFEGLLDTRRKTV